MANHRNAADLLRAAEQLGFATLARYTPAGGQISPDLKASLAEHFDELINRADDHWEDAGEQSNSLSGLYRSLRKNADRSLEEGAYYAALEFARAAEALAHVKLEVSRKLSAGKAKLQLPGV